MSTPGNRANLGATHSNIQTAQRGPSLVGTDLFGKWVSTLTHYASQFSFIFEFFYYFKNTVVYLSILFVSILSMLFATDL